MEQLLGWLWRDIRFALRNLAKDRRFSVLAILALGLGIGSVTVIFSAVYGVIIDTFPYAHFDRMVSFSINAPGQAGLGEEFLTIPELLDFRDQNHVFQDMEGGSSNALHYVNGNQTTQWTATRETANGYQFFGVQPLLGRLITPADMKPGSPPVFMMTYQLWRDQFNRDPNIVGKTFQLDGVYYTLVGIMPPRFRAGWNDIYTAFPMNKSEIENDPTLKNAYVWPLGLLKPGVTVEQAAADLDIVAHNLAKVYPHQFPKTFHVTARSFQDRVTPMFTGILYPLLGAVLLLFLIACTNVANLLLSRATSREREIAIRESLGATRWRLLRQLLVESFILAVLGCGVGCLFALLGIRELVPLIPYNNFPQESVIELNGVVLLAAMGLAVVATIVCGFVPAMRAIGGQLQPRLAAAGMATSADRRQGKLRAVLVASEVALSIVLLTGAGLLLRTFFGMTHVDLGYDPNRVLAIDMQFPPHQYQTAVQRELFFQQLVDKLKTVPGVLTAAQVLTPNPGGFNTAISVMGGKNTEPRYARLNLVDKDFFPTFNYHLLLGRTITEDDVVAQRKVIVVNEAFARKFLPKGQALGQEIDVTTYDQIQKQARQEDQKTSPAAGKPQAPEKTYFEVVGVVSDVKSGGFDLEARPAAFLPRTAAEQFVSSIAVRTVGDADKFSGAIVQQIWGIDRDITLSNDRGSIENRLQKYDYARPQFEFIMLSTFASVGLLLVIIGVYSVMAYNVSLQTREFGIRMALGAQQADVLRAVLRHGAVLIGAGIVAGLFLAWAAARLIRNQLWNVKPSDPSTYGAVILLVVLVGFLACIGPARRATQVDPLVALRDE